jgi:hypothetical protein
LFLQTKNQASSAISYFHPSVGAGWEDLTNPIPAIGAGDTIVAINLVIHSSGAFAINLGRISLDPNILGVNAATAASASMLVYPNPSNGIVTVENKTMTPGGLKIYNLHGQQVWSQDLSGGQRQQIKLDSNAVYLYEFKTAKEFKQGKIIVY